MVMPSQSPRSRSFGGSRRRRKGVPPMLIVAAVLGAAGLWMLWPSGESADQPAAAQGATPPAVQAAGPAPTQALPEGVRPPLPVRAEPARIETQAPSSDLERAAPPVLPELPRQEVPAAALTGDFGEGMRLLSQGEFLRGRQLLSDLLFNRPGALSPHQGQMARDRLTQLNLDPDDQKHDGLIYGPDTPQGDTVTFDYRVQPGDRLASLQNTVRVPYRFIERINNVTASRLQAGQNIKMVRGPFHARVIKSAYRMDLFLVDPQTGQPVFVGSLPVGLGEDDSTPEGRFVIKPGGKVGKDPTNPRSHGPSWRNPRTGEFWEADDPNIPIGDYWLALQGQEAHNQDITGYGLHGTNDPDSIGDQRSMGCIRMRDRDIHLVYDMLFEGHSTVEIVP
ncbi:MAG: L,D-transpeptidase family protein [Planctomycetota bacterium]